MILLKNFRELKEWRSKASGSVGFVPTMGALHAGHQALLQRAKQSSQQCILSIFVNPKQFGPQEDFNHYPRTLEADIDIATQEGVNALFLPSPEEMYPGGYSTYVSEREFTQGLCGSFRPGHFEGVTTIVLKLFNLVNPSSAFFGLKDIQQYFVLSKMVLDLNLDIELIGVPTVREKDGLALSSRNRYLSSKERTLAPRLYQHLIACKKNPSLIPAASRELTLLGFDVQYFEKRSFDLGEKGTFHILAIAAYLGQTRLIDNISLDSPIF